MDSICSNLLVRKIKELRNKEADICGDYYIGYNEDTPYMVSEFIDRIEVHERDRKGSSQTTQTIDIYFNFIGNYRMPTVEPTPEEIAERERIEAIKDKRHRAYLRRKQSGWQAKYYNATKDKKKAKLRELKAQNPNPYEIPAEEFDKEHWSRESVVLANSEKADF